VPVARTLGPQLLERRVDLRPVDPELGGEPFGEPVAPVTGRRLLVLADGLERRAEVGLLHAEAVGQVLEAGASEAAAGRARRRTTWPAQADVLALSRAAPALRHAVAGLAAYRVRAEREHRRSAGERGRPFHPGGHRTSWGRFPSTIASASVTPLRSGHFLVLSHSASAV
jgi:hypothetical protein